MQADLLFLAHRVPYPPDKGDRIRTFHLLKFLSRRARVHLVCLADEPVAESTRATLERYCHRVAIVPVGKVRWAYALASLARGRTLTEGAFFSRRLRRILSHWAEDTSFAAALASSSSVAPHLHTPAWRHVPLVVDLVDVDSQKWFDYAQTQTGPRARLYAREGRCLRRLEKKLASWAHALTLVSPAEVAVLRGFCSDGKVLAVPNGVDLDYFRPGDNAVEPSCVFVGALDYLPNVDAASWFAQEVWPAVHGRNPMAKLYLVGRRPVPAVVRLGAVPGVEVVGQVPDVRPYVARSAVSVNPLRIARGVQNKVLEALAMGKATVASPEALAGLAVEHNVHVKSATTPSAWIETVTRLLTDADERHRLGANGRAYVEAHHRWDGCLRPLAGLLNLEPGELAEACAPAGVFSATEG